MQTYTGDTIVHSSSCAKAAQREAECQRRLSDNHPLHPGEVPELGAINIPPPVFFCSVEPSSAAQQKGIATAIIVVNVCMELNAKR